MITEIKIVLAVAVICAASMALAYYLDPNMHVTYYLTIGIMSMVVSALALSIHTTYKALKEIK